MRQWWGILIFVGIVALPSSVWAQGQATINEGWASNVVRPGTYATPFVPQLVTPNISFETFSANPVGATNATSGNVAGAANAKAVRVFSNEDVERQNQNNGVVKYRGKVENVG
jgi:hypothetical protein